MLRLQEKAHISLDDFRKGKSSPLGRGGSASEPPTPVDDNDELATLGGKTRLVSKKETSSPPMIDRSPTSMNPVVPLPLSTGNGHQVHPNVLEYLRTFGPAQVPEPAPVPSSPFADVSMYGLSTVGPYHVEPTAYQGTQMQQQQQHSPQQQPQLSMMNGGSFPQYFPVYDYAQPGTENGFSPMMENHVGDRRRGSGTPEANMQTTWQDFVAGLGMN